MTERAALKAEQFLSSKEPSWQFLHAICTLDPNQLLSLPQTMASYEAIPGLTTVILADNAVERECKISERSQYETEWSSKNY